MLHQRLWSTAFRIVAAGFVAGASAASAQAETLKLAHFVAPAHTLTKAVVEPLVNGVAAATGGELDIRVYPGGELGKGPLEQYVRALQGVADITFGLQGYTSSQFPKTMLAELPGMKPAGKMGYAMFYDAFEAHLADEFPGTIPLALWLSEPNVLVMKNTDVRSPGDLEGLKIRVAGSAAAAVVEALGATPVQMPAPKIYNALQTGLVDGVVTGASAVTDFKLDEVATSYTLGAPLGRIAFYLVMNEQRYEGLDEAHKAAIDANSGRVLSDRAETAWNTASNTTIQMLRDTGDNTVIDLTEDEAAAFAALTLPVADQIIGKLGAQAVAKTMRGE